MKDQDQIDATEEITEEINELDQALEETSEEVVEEEQLEMAADEADENVEGQAVEALVEAAVEAFEAVSGEEGEIEEAGAVEATEESEGAHLELVADEAEATEEIEEEEPEEEEFIPTEQLESILESMLFVSDKAISVNTMKQAFKGTSITTRQIKKALDQLQIEFASAHRGVTLEEVNGGYRLHTKVDNMDFLKRLTKVRPFRLSGPALEVMAIIAYKQPIVKAEVDEIRGVESGHLVRALMDKGLVNFAGKSELPGKPMMYGTSKKFLEIFSLKSLKDLPTLAEIDELLPEGIGEEEEEKPTLDMLTDELSEEVSDKYSEGEEELLKISDKLATINTSSEFFEEERRRQREKRDAERARDIREALEVGEEVSTRDKNWLGRWEEAQKAAEAEAETVIERPGSETEVSEGAEATEVAAGEDVEIVADPDDRVTQIQAEEAVRAFEEDDIVAVVNADEEAESIQAEAIVEAHSIDGAAEADSEEEIAVEIEEPVDGSEDSSQGN